MYQEVDAPEGRRTVCALRIGEPLNDYGDLELVILPLSMIWMRLVGRGDYRVVVCRTTRLGRFRPVYRSERMSKSVAKDHVAALVALAGSAVGAGEQTTP